jgi:hypothetical protein
MLTKILTAILGIVIALMVIRHFVDRAQKARARLRRQPAQDRAAKITTLEPDPDGVYRPKS